MGDFFTRNWDLFCFLYPDCTFIEVTQGSYITCFRIQYLPDSQPDAFAVIDEASLQLKILKDFHKNFQGFPIFSIY